MSLTDELQKLHQLREAGAITEAEFIAAKTRLIHEPSPGGYAPPPLHGEWNAETLAAKAKEWGLILHLSQFCGLAVPFAGFIVPIVIWQIKKDEYPLVDAHGKVVANWLISFLIYGVCCFLLAIILVGFPLLIALGAVGLIFPIVGAIKANNGEVWRYPLSITFFA